MLEEVEYCIPEDNATRARIRDTLGLTDGQLRPLIKELKSEGLLEEKHGGLWLDYDLWLGYLAHYGDEWAINKIARAQLKRKSL